MAKKPYVLLRMDDLCEKLQLSRATLYNLMRESSRYYDPNFPKHVKLTSNSVAWIEDQIDEWIESKMSAAQSS